MVQARFGTDGVRGVANAELTPELVLALGRATARILPAPAFIVGRDTRRSGPLLQAALAAGLAGEGADVIDAGVLPTPAVAWMSAQRDLPAAVPDVHELRDRAVVGARLDVDAADVGEVSEHLRDVVAVGGEDDVARERDVGVGAELHGKAAQPSRVAAATLWSRPGHMSIRIVYCTA